MPAEIDLFLQINNTNNLCQTCQTIGDRFECLNEGGFRLSSVRSVKKKLKIERREEVIDWNRTEQSKEIEQSKLHFALRLVAHLH